MGPYFAITTAMDPSMGVIKRDRKKNPKPDRPLEEAQTPQKMLNKNQLSRRKNIITISVSIFQFFLEFMFVVFLRFDRRPSPSKSLLPPETKKTFPSIERNGVHIFLTISSSRPET